MNRAVGIMISVLQMAQHPPWSASICSRSFSVIPNRYLSLSLVLCVLIFSGCFQYRLLALLRSFKRDCSKFSYRLYIALSLKHSLQHQALPSGDAACTPNASSGLRSLHVEQKRPSAVTRGVLSGGFFSRHLSHLCLSYPRNLSGFSRRCSFWYAAQQALHLWVWPQGFHLLGVNSVSGFSTPHFLHLNVMAPSLKVRTMAIG